MLKLFELFRTAPLLLALIMTTSCGASGSKASTAQDESSNADLSCIEAANAERIPPEEAPETIELSHILVRHKKLARPKNSTRTMGEACLRALDALKALEEGNSWDDVVSKYSDSPGPSNGALGTVSRDDLTDSFGNAAFALEVDELSYVVESERGFHIIVRNQ